MSENASQKIYTDLGLSLWSDTMIYIPKEVFDKEKLSKIDFDFNSILNKFLETGFKNSFTINEIGKDYTKFLTKGQGLDRLIFELLTHKTALETHKFNYILEKYHTQAEFYFYITGWLTKNLSKYMTDKVDDTIFSIFQIQFINSKYHFEELIKHFYPTKDLIPIGIFDVMEMIEEHFPNLLAKYSRADNVNSSEATENTVAQNPESNTPKSSKKVKKKPLITKEEADTFLLKSVFNVKL